MRPVLLASNNDLFTNLLSAILKPTYPVKVVFNGEVAIAEISRCAGG